MTRPLHILLVENHEDTLHYLHRHLEDEGHSVTAARTAGEARMASVRGTPDVLLCDIGLPDDDGWKLVSGMGNSRPQLCIAMSGRGMASDVRRSLEAGFQHHLVKPFLPADLDALLARD